jgi:hypothetical protein
MNINSIQLSLVLSFCLVTLFAGCSQETIEPEPQLPPITKKGLNTFGCLVDGELFLYEDVFELFVHSNILYDVYRDSVLEISAKDRPSNSSIYIETIYHRGQKTVDLYNPNALAEGKITQYINHSKKFGGARYFIIENDLGSLKLIRDDDIAIVGTFSFDVIGEDRGDTIHITEGRFDILKEH